MQRQCLRPTAVGGAVATSNRNSRVCAYIRTDDPCANNSAADCSRADAAAEWRTEPCAYDKRTRCRHTRADQGAAALAD